MSSKPEFTNPVIRWVEERLPVFSYLQHEYRDFPMPKNLNYFWNFGALASICLVVMLVTGIILAICIIHRMSITRSTASSGSCGTSTTVG